jgi:hypothetical protein
MNRNLTNYGTSLITNMPIMILTLVVNRISVHECIYHIERGSIVR